MEIGVTRKSKSAEQVLYLLHGAPANKLCASKCFPKECSSSSLLSARRNPSSYNLRFNYPSARGREQFHAYRVAVATQRLAISHASLGTKLSRARRQNHGRALFPAPHADHARSLGADVFGKRRFRAGQNPMAVENDGNLHRDAIFAALEGMNVPGRHIRRSSQARGNARDGIHGAASATVFHAVEGAVGSTQKLFRGVAVLRIGGDARAHRERGFLGFNRKAFADAGRDSGSNFFWRFGKDECELVSAVAGGRVNGARMVLESFSQAHQGAAANQMPVAVVDGL